MVLVYLLFLVLIHSSSTEAEQIHLCEGDNYTVNSTFGSNLNLLLANLTSSGSIFSTATIGASPDRVYGLVLCRGDQDPSSCTTCYKMLSHNITQLCPYNTRATMWDRNCELRYSNISFFDSLDTQEVYDHCFDSDMKTTSDSFANMSRLLFRNTSYQAAFNSSLMFATGMLSYSESQIFSLAQCTMDLSKELCSQCLNQILDYYWNVCTQIKIGIWFIGKSCNYRYEITPFYVGDPTVLLTLPLFSPPPMPSLVSPPTAGEGKKNTHKVLITVIFLAVMLILITTTLFICFWRRSKKTTYDKMKDIVSAEPLLFDLRTLEVATDGFSDANMLGRGGFGAVYKGILPDGQEIAVKRLSTSSIQGLGELKNELVLVARLQHKNLVRLRGICLEEEEKLLVYQYVPNRSLDTFLYDPTKCLELSWARRFEIIEGIASGLRYLHEESHWKIIHRDLKASNILLDANFKPKISDFGLARLFGVNETHNTTSKVVGTFGYMAPEYAMRGQLSVKLDVFSFGVLVLEIVTGRKNNRDHDSEHVQDLLSYAWQHWREDKALEIIDPSLAEQFSQTEALRCIQIGLLCVQDFPADRPLMSSIVLMLQNPFTAFQAPLQPTRGATTCKLTSVNDVTISELYPR